LPKAWVEARKRDYYYRKAKEEKYRSRAAYKLLQVIKKYNLIKKGDTVVDLGAAPGGWLQISSKTVGEKGFVLGVDLKPIEPLDYSNVRTIVADINDSDIVSQVREFLPYSVDVVISDVSPNISGIWELDHARQIDLARQSLRIAVGLLRAGGSFFVKVFQGDMLNDFVEEVKQYFSFVKIIKPKASKAKSSELYVLCMKFKRQANT